MALSGPGLVLNDSFVLEGSSSDCQETELKRDLILYCNGGVKLRELTDEDQTDRTDEDIPPKKGAQDEKADRVSAILQQLLNELLD